MKTNAAGVFAAGDIVEFPLFLNDDQQSNVQHWQMAHQHGQCTMARLALSSTGAYLIKGHRSEGSSWAENVESVQLFSSACFVRFCYQYFTKTELKKKKKKRGK